MMARTGTSVPFEAVYVLVRRGTAVLLKGAVCIVIAFHPVSVSVGKFHQSKGVHVVLQVFSKPV
jgi:hypothetical protein